MAILKYEESFGGEIMNGTFRYNDITIKGSSISITTVKHLVEENGYTLEDAVSAVSKAFGEVLERGDAN